VKQAEKEESVVRILASIPYVFLEVRRDMMANSRIDDGLSWSSREWVMAVQLLVVKRLTMLDGLGILTRMVRDETIVTFYSWRSVAHSILVGLYRGKLR
jgi:hypothetical protein